MAQTNVHAPALTASDGGAAKAAPRKVITAEQVNALVAENSRLRQMVARMDATNAFRRLDYLFMVVRSAERFNPDFVSGCVSEIEASLTVPERPADAAERGGGNEAGDGGE